MNVKYKKDYLRIIQIEGCDLYYSAHFGKPLTIKNPEYDFHSKFKDLISLNLDLLYLDSINKLSVKEHLGEQYSYDFVNVSFNYSLRVDTNGKQIVGNKKSKAKVTTIDVLDIRKELYLNGFKINGTHYVRYKRSSGAARTGHCLFIKESLFKKMDKWSNAGLKVNVNDIDLVSFEAYKSLSLSGLIETYKFNPYNILFVDDEVAILKDEKVARVFVNEDKHLDVVEQECDVKNTIWDGEGLLDVSVFNDLKDKSKAFGNENIGMLLLRNRYFKSCVFNTNLKEWFKEKGITRINQLNGITLAKSVDDIKMVVTKSSLKYLKLLDGKLNKRNIKKWCDAISDENKESIFGIVKTDKPSRFFYGDMAETSYSLLNTIYLKPTKVRALLAPNLDYFDKVKDIKKHPEYLRLYLKGEIDPYDYEETEELDDSEDLTLAEDLVEETSYTYKKLMAFTLLDVNKDVLKTPFFKYFVYDETINSLYMKLYSGRVLVDGTYSTLFGNPYELLLHIVGEYDGRSHFLKKGEICTIFYENNEKIVGSRFPHITMGNILYSTNRRDSQIEKWFNLTREIVIVDAIENNIQQRLNGADYDSDAMLITNNKVIKQAVEEHYDEFLVPFADLNPERKTLETLSEDEKENIVLNQAVIDYQISNNMVGAITNNAQLLNSIYWNRRYEEKPVDDIYLNICKLAVLCGAEIDSAKRSFAFSTSEELKRFNGYYKSLNNKKRPLFFYRIDHSDYFKIGFVKDHIRKYRKPYFGITMDNIWNHIFVHSLSDKRITDSATIYDLVKKESLQRKNSGGQQYKIVNKIIEELDTIYKSLGDQYKSNDDKNKFIYDKRELTIRVNRSIKDIGKNLLNPDIVKITIKKLHEKYNKDKKQNQKGRYSSLMFILFYLLYRINGKSGLQNIFESNSPIKEVFMTSYDPKSELSLFEKYSYQTIKDRKY